MRVVSDAPPEPNWLERHLNWTVVLAEIAVSIVLGIVFLLLFALAFTIDYLSTGEVENSLFWVMMLIYTILHLAVILPVAGWALRKKCRSLWWLLILFVPVAGDP